MSCPPQVTSTSAPWRVCGRGQRASAREHVCANLCECVRLRSMRSPCLPERVRGRVSRVVCVRPCVCAAVSDSVLRRVCVSVPLSCSVTVTVPVCVCLCARVVLCVSASVCQHVWVCDRGRECVCATQPMPEPQCTPHTHGGRPSRRTGTFQNSRPGLPAEVA